MSRRFLMKQVAQQSGLSLATVDRVMNRRPGVRAHTQHRVEEALCELEKQQRLLSMQGRTFMLDVVMEAPQRFSRVAIAALDANVSMMQPAVLRSRLHVKEAWKPGGLAKRIEKISASDSQGVLIKAPQTEEIERAIERLQAANIPVVTLASDQQPRLRQAYVGLDNCEAGETAAYLMNGWMRDRDFAALVSLTSETSNGEEARMAAFKAQMEKLRSDVVIHRVDQGRGLNLETEALVKAKLQSEPMITAVYSVGGANCAILQAFTALNRTADVFIGHDLDEDNTALLKQHKITAVLHHDLRRNLRRACEVILEFHGLHIDARPQEQGVQVTTPFNLR